MISVLIGIPLAIWMGRSKAATAAITPVLDILQTFPAFTYLTPLAIFFGIGSASAVVATVLFAFPPVVRIAAYGIETVSSTSIEATRSLGQTRWQEIRKVQLPMAKRTIIVGINQTTMAALSMVIIAAFVGAPGLGQPVLQGLQTRPGRPGLRARSCDRHHGDHARPHDHSCERACRAAPASRWGKQSAALHHAGRTGAVAVVCIYLSHTYTWAAGFPESDFGIRLADKVQSMADWIAENWDTQTGWISDRVSYGLLNPLQDLLPSHRGSSQALPSSPSPYCSVAGRHCWSR